ncbi:MAG: hypothetical protein SNH18_09420 [Rikenellaceae bacterium]
MGFTVEEFEQSTPAQFVYAWLGWSKLQEQRTRQEWERERWSLWVNTSCWISKKDRKPMHAAFPLPWDEHMADPSTELTRDERRERAKRLLNRKKHKQ